MNSAIPIVSLFDIWPGIERSPLPNDMPVNGVAGTAPVPDRWMLARICRHIKARNVFEIGTLRGYTALTLARYTPAHVVTLDLPAEWAKSGDHVGRDAELLLPYDTLRVYEGTRAEGRITQLWGDSRRFNPGPLAGLFDLVFVDGAHDPASHVVADSRLALKLARYGGWLVWHDAYSPDIAPREPPKPAVWEALEELADEGWFIRLINNAPLAVYRKRYNDAQVLDL